MKETTTFEKAQETIKNIVQAKTKLALEIGLEDVRVDYKPMPWIKIECQYNSKKIGQLVGKLLDNNNWTITHRKMQEKQIMTAMLNNGEKCQILKNLSQDLQQREKVLFVSPIYYGQKYYNIDIVVEPMEKIDEFCNEITSIAPLQINKTKTAITVSM